MDVPFYKVHTINGTVLLCVGLKTERIKMRHKKRREFVFVFSSSALILQTFNSSDCRPYWCTVRNRLSFRWWTRRACVVVWRTRRE